MFKKTFPVIYPTFQQVPKLSGFVIHQQPKPNSSKKVSVPAQQRCVCVCKKVYFLDHRFG